MRLHELIAVALMSLLPRLNVSASSEPRVLQRAAYTTGKCQVFVTKRTDCGFFGISSKQCRDRGCCWVPCKGTGCKGVPWCYHTKDMVSKRCMTAKKIECGYYGIKEPACLKKGCCWKPVSKPKDPWCFKAKSGKPGPEGCTGPGSIWSALLGFFC